MASLLHLGLSAGLPCHRAFVLRAISLLFHGGGNRVDVRLSIPPTGTQSWEDNIALAWEVNVERFSKFKEK